MHIAIIGAGLAGVSAAWYLSQTGHRVTVIERDAAPALETSYANGGQISISHPEPWANPGAPMQVLRWLGKKDAPLLFRWPAEAARIRWGLEFLRECLPGRTRQNTLAIAHLAAFSGQRLKALREETGIEYNQLSRGVLHMYFSPENLHHGEQQHKILQELGIGSRMLDRDACLELEPALAHLAPHLVGAMLGSDDESGDAQRFATELARCCREAGVEFVFDTSVASIEADGQRVSGLSLRSGNGEARLLQADAYVLAAGSYSPQLMRPHGERLAIYPVKGYSTTMELAQPDKAPTVSLTDESRRIVCSRFGNRLRIAGTAELNGYNLDLDLDRCSALLRWAEDMFPGACNTAEPNYWTGLRPTTPSNLPIIGRSRLANLFYNTGHGTLGWTLACGSAQALADIMNGQQPAVDYPFWKSR
ncbi:D-amino acid dehydrogenase [Uliginosibacterium gangwonense]|uniref:D-amino acid dehydrogenase n=1 Tax=Uliginosibacterium gangwonense TaxID=392736 RepID=UPI00036D3D95|nr:D-amino acid dehydrogenase [Uliginosibacterium gangwonense]